MRPMTSIGSIPVRLSRSITAVSLGLLCAGSSLADSNAERAALTRLALELVSLEPMIRTAESQADPDTRIRFRYDWLREDLERVRRGVQDHIDAPRAEPRSFAPLRGDYRQ